MVRRVVGRVKAMIRIEEETYKNTVVPLVISCLAPLLYRGKSRKIGGDVDEVLSDDFPAGVPGRIGSACGGSFVVG